MINPDHHQVFGWLIVVVPFINQDIRICIWRVLTCLVPPIFYVASTEEGLKRRVQGVLDIIREKAPKFEDNTVYSISV